MLLGYKEAKQIKGTFNEYEYCTTITTENGVTESYWNYFFARSHSDAQTMFEEWQRQCTISNKVKAMYKYTNLECTGITNLTALKIVEIVHPATNWKRMLSHIVHNERDYIQ